MLTSLGLHFCQDGNPTFQIVLEKEESRIICLDLFVQN